MFGKKKRYSAGISIMIDALSKVCPDQVQDGLPAWRDSRDLYYVIPDRGAFSDRHLHNAIWCCRKKKWVGLLEVGKAHRFLALGQAIDGKSHDEYDQDVQDKLIEQAKFQLHQFNRHVMVDILLDELDHRGLALQERSHMRWERIFNQVTKEVK